MSTNLHMIEELPLFSGLTESVRSEIISVARYCRFTKGENIFFHADPASQFYILVRGVVRVCRQTPQGAETTLYIAEPGDMLACSELFEERSHYQANAVAIKDCVLLTYSHRWIKTKIQEYPRFAMNILAAVSRSASRTLVDKELLSTANAPQRIGCLLLQLCERHSMDPKSFSLPYSKAILASRLGMPPESFSRALIALRDVGVSVKGRKICITNLRALEDYACSSCSIGWDCETCVRLHLKHPYRQKGEIDFC